MSEFKQIADGIKASGKPRKITVRELIQSIGKERRGKYVSRSLRNKLRYSKLTTDPDFDLVHIDAEVWVKPMPDAEPAKVAAPGKPTEKLVITDAPRDSVVTIRQGIPNAGKAPVTVRPELPVQTALSRLMSDELELLIVQNGIRSRVEGVFSYASYAHAQMAGKATQTVADCMNRDFIEINEEKPLIDAVRDIIQHGTVVVRSRDNQLCGVVTARDVAPVFVDLAEPFLLLGQIENHMRGLLERAKLKKEDYKSLVVESDLDRKTRTEGPDDLTLGELIVAFEGEEMWGKVGLKFDKATFTKRLHGVREIRNKVMHFSPDGLPADDITRLKSTRELLEKL